MGGVLVYIDVDDLVTIGQQYETTKVVDHFVGGPLDEGTVFKDL